MPVTVNTLSTLLESSAATDNFRKAVQEVEKTKRPAIGFQFSLAVPGVKALRAVTKLLEEEPALQIERVEIDGRSGCSDFEGRISVNGGEAVYDFRWDCAWRAEQEGYTDHWGSPDQIRAAQEFGYQCFERFTRIK